MPSSWREAIVSVMRWQPIWRAVDARTGSETKNHTCAPFPDRDRSTRAGRASRRAVSANARTSSLQVLLSKSTIQGCHPRHRRARPDGYGGPRGAPPRRPAPPQASECVPPRPRSPQRRRLGGERQLSTEPIESRAPSPARIPPPRSGCRESVIAADASPSSPGGASRAPPPRSRPSHRAPQAPACRAIARSERAGPKFAGDRAGRIPASERSHAT